MKTKLVDCTDVIRSKNAGPYELTLDIIFSDFDTYERVSAAKAISPAMIATLYGMSQDAAMDIIYFHPAKAVKITMKRPFCSGNIGETDVYGAQQHAPLLDAWIDI